MVYWRMAFRGIFLFILNIIWFSCNSSFQKVLNDLSIINGCLFMGERVMVDMMKIQEIPCLQKNYLIFMKIEYIEGFITSWGLEFGIQNLWRAIYKVYAMIFEIFNFWQNMGATALIWIYFSNFAIWTPYFILKDICFRLW